MYIQMYCVCLKWKLDVSTVHVLSPDSKTGWLLFTKMHLYDLLEEIFNVFHLFVLK